MSPPCRRLRVVLVLVLTVGSLHVDAASARRTLKQGTRDIVPGDTACPPGVAVAQCFVEPCALVRCRGGTTCVNNYCGGCGARCDPSDSPPPDEGPAPPPPAACVRARGVCNCTQQCCGATALCVSYDVAAPQEPSPSNASNSNVTSPAGGEQAGSEEGEGADAAAPSDTPLAGAANATTSSDVLGVCLPRNAVQAARRRSREPGGNLTSLTILRC